MLKSMTAYGRATLVVPLGQFTAELYSVNRRYLEINNFYPKDFLCFDADIKSWIAAEVSRGSITVKLSAQFETATPLTIKPNLALARQLKNAWDQIAIDLMLPPERGFKLEMLQDVEQVLLFESNPDLQDQFKAVLKQVIKQALEKLVKMKENEGLALSQDILARLDTIKESINELDHLAPHAANRFQQELQLRIEELLPGRIENEERILREICIYAEKVDISEELTRLRSHLKQFADLIKSSIGSVGKTLDFLVQEMNREINTIGSKASELKISQIVVSIKSELERIREQVQNIE